MAKNRKFVHSSKNHTAILPYLVTPSDETVDQMEIEFSLKQTNLLPLSEQELHRLAWLNDLDFQNHEHQMFAYDYGYQSVSAYDYARLYEACYASSPYSIGPIFRRRTPSFDYGYEPPFVDDCDMPFFFDGDLDDTYWDHVEDVPSGRNDQDDFIDWAEDMLEFSDFDFDWKGSQEERFMQSIRLFGLRYKERVSVIRDYSF